MDEVFVGKYLGVGVGDLCFDIGAGDGNITRTLVNAGASVVAVDPVNRGISNMTPHIEGQFVQYILAPVVGGMSAPAVLYCPKDPAFELQTTLVETPSFNKVYLPNPVTVDLLIEEHGMPKLIYIDVNGGEYSVLAGMSKLPELLLIHTKLTPEIITNTIEPVVDMLLDKFHSQTKLDKIFFNFFFDPLIGFVTHWSVDWKDDVLLELIDLEDKGLDEVTIVVNSYDSSFGRQ